MKAIGITEFYQDFFKYNHIVNLNLAESIKAMLPQLIPKVIHLACHIINAHSIWNSRLIRNSDPCKPWDLFPIQEFAQRDKENYQRTLEILESVELGNMIIYKNSIGKEFEKYASNMLTHIVNHSTYHRGQIAMLMRESGLDPIPSDFILFNNQI